ncbi:hypothetical protein Sgleb_26490 [Streptomyces glebosus]|uniref:Uncharacterized protein n=1 Tax=Streptomyces glebosus TaxID=249580 RepID=A0A640SUQ4_9ACTN|nr:hypothetical protein Sgleb_26490 [Streptomyces glebosus]GHG88607.1 hypothetical protein GCM10010513_70900 [Streptomyces glebosus]
MGVVGEGVDDLGEVGCGPSWGVIRSCGAQARGERWDDRGAGAEFRQSPEVPLGSAQSGGVARCRQARWARRRGPMAPSISRFASAMAAHSRKVGVVAVQ